MTLDEIEAWLDENITHWPGSAEHADVLHPLPRGFEWVEMGDGSPIVKRSGQHIGPSSTGKRGWIWRAVKGPHITMSPTPWRVDLTNSVLTIRARDGEEVANCGNFLEDLQRCPGNASLMGAAPEMKNLLHDALAFAKDQGETHLATRISDLFDRIGKTV